MVNALETVKQKLLESLAFAGVTREEVDSLIKIAEPITCFYLNVQWRDDSHWVTLRVNTFKRYGDLKDERKLITVKVHTEKGTVHDGLEHVEGEIQEFRIELEPPPIQP